MASRPIVAVDLGGTKILAAVVTHDSRVVAREYQPTPDAGEPGIVAAILSAIDRLLARNSLQISQFEALSLAAAGAVDMEHGVLTQSPNLPHLRDAPLRDIVQQRYALRTCLIHDASACALAEHRLGAGRGCRNMVYLTVSTGIGGGIITDGRLYLGASGGAGEIGHMTIDAHGSRDNCGNIGCLEGLASGTAIARAARKRLVAGEASVLGERFAGKTESLSAEDVARAAGDGDTLAREVVSQAAYFLGVGLVNVVNIFNPEVVVIGGGVARMGEPLLAPARQVVAERAFRLNAQDARIVTSTLGDDAGVLGAAIYAREQEATVGRA